MIKVLIRCVLFFVGMAATKYISWHETYYGIFVLFGAAWAVAYCFIIVQWNVEDHERTYHSTRR